MLARLYLDLSVLDPQIVPLVRVITAIGLPPVYACAGHAEERRGIMQYAYPVVLLSLETNDERQKCCFQRLVEMLGIFNNSCHSQYDVAWVLDRVESQQFGHVWSLGPASTGRPLRELHRGIELLVYNLGLMNEWYTQTGDES